MRGVTVGFVVMFSLLYCNLSIAQTKKSLVIHPFQDANLSVDTNFNNSTGPHLSCLVWTVQGTWFQARSCIDFRHDVIPQDAKITKATLSLQYIPYGDYHLFSVDQTILIERIVEPWVDIKLFWANKPKTTTVNSVIVPTDTTRKSYKSIDITQLMNDMITKVDSSYGLALRIADTTNKYQGIIFASSDYFIDSLRPKIYVEYELPDSVVLNVASNKGDNVCYADSTQLTCISSYPVTWYLDSLYQQIYSNTNPVWVIPTQRSTYYARNSIGQRGQITLDVNEDVDCYQIKVFELVTPNLDAKNEVLWIDNITKIPDNELRVFNRWGQLLKQISRYDNTYTCADLEDGEYAYDLRVKKEHYTGTFIVRRK